MAYTNAVFYPTAATQDQTIGAGVVRAILNAVPVVNSTSQCTWTAATAADITVIPLANNSTTGTDTTANNGWAFNNANATGLGSTATARRVILAGVWAFQGTVNLNIPATLQTVSATIKAVVYRVATGGGARTELFRTAASAAVTNASAIAAADVNWTVSSASQPQIILAAGEVIMVGYIITSRNTVNTLGAITNTVVTFHLGNQLQANQFTVPSSGIRTLFSSTLAAVVAVVATLIRQVRKPLSALGVGNAVFSRRITGFRSFANVATGNADFARAVTAARLFANVATVVASRLVRLSAFRTLPATVTVVPTLAKRAFKSFAAISTAVPAFSRLITAFKSFANVSTVIPAFSRSVTNRRTLSAVATVIPALTRRTGKLLTAIATGTATKAVRVGKLFANVATVVPAFAKVIQKGTFIITATVTPAFARAVTAARLFTATVNGAAKMFVQISDTILSRMVSGGGTTIIKKVTTLIFDD